MVINPIKYKSRTRLKCDLQALYKLLTNTLLVNWCSVQQQDKKKQRLVVKWCPDEQLLSGVWDVELMYVTGDILYIQTLSQ